MAILHEPIVHSLTDELCGVIRSHRPTLSTGAYGDEGEILMAIESHIAQVLQSAPMAHLKMVCSTSLTDLGDLDDILTAAKTFLVGWKPIRFTIPGEMVHELREHLHQALRTEETRSGVSYHYLRESLFQALDARGVVSLVRGDDTWQLLHSLQLLHLLGAFLVEQEALPAEKGN